jgi:tetratricopeptide (TPR) repeat protein
MAAYERAMADVARKHPDDAEATVFHALALVATADAADTMFAKQKRAAAMLTPLVKRLPTHPGLAHYIIHANDNPRLASLALDAARAYASIAPSSVHARHMPSHIFTRLGMWDESAASNRSAEEIAPGPHTAEYLVYAFLQRGREAEARQFSPKYAALPGGRLEVALIDARPAVELGQWAEAARLKLRPAMRGVTAATMRFARALGAARSGDTAAARVEIAELASLRDVQRSRGDSYLAAEAEIQRLAASAWLQFAAGDTSGGLAHASQASDLEDNTEDKTNTAGRLLPARELYGEMLLLSARAVDALRELERSLELNPNRARGLFLAAQAADRAGRADAAKRHYTALATLLEGSDPGRPDSKAALDYLSRRER